MPGMGCRARVYQFEVGQGLHEGIQAARDPGCARFPVQQRRQPEGQDAVGRVHPDLRVRPMEHRRKRHAGRLHGPEAVL